MTVTISAAFDDYAAAFHAARLLKNEGYRLSLNRQRPEGAFAGTCPGTGLPAHFHSIDSVMAPDGNGAVLTVLVDNETSAYACGLIRSCGGRMFH